MADVLVDAVDVGLEVDVVFSDAVKSSIELDKVRLSALVVIV